MAKDDHFEQARRAESFRPKTVPLKIDIETFQAVITGTSNNALEGEVLKLIDDHVRGAGVIVVVNGKPTYRAVLENGEFKLANLKPS